MEVAHSRLLGVTRVRVLGVHDKCFRWMAGNAMRLIAALVLGFGKPGARSAGGWSLDEGTGTSAADSSGSSNTGTLSNSPTWTMGKIGGALAFNGTNQHVTAGAAASLANLQRSGMTVMAWIKPNSPVEAGSGASSTRTIRRATTAGG
jgi:hypothetical protein